MLTGTEWSNDSIELIWDEVRDIAKKYNWEGFPVIFEIVSAEQMVNCYTSHGLPNMYEHWSFGKRFLQHMQGLMDEDGGHLAYELIINSDPSICYLMNTNTQLMQLLTIAHAGIGHNHFFKHNYMFKQHTNPSEIINFLLRSKAYIEKCEEKYGKQEVEWLLDLSHTIDMFSINKYFKKDLTKKDKKEQTKSRVKEIQESYDPITKGSYLKYKDKLLGDGSGNNESLLYDNLIQCLCDNFKLNRWQKKVLNISQQIMQYFYPQGCTKMMNEGFASFVQHIIIDDLYTKGLIGEDYMLEFLDNHTAVVNQHWFNGKSFPKINPYYLGYNIFMDIKRMCENPTQEDIDFCPHICNTNWITTINDVVANYRDDSFIQQFLSPYLIRKLKLIQLETVEEVDYIGVEETHNSRGYDSIRNTLAKMYNWDDNYIYTVSSVHDDRHLTLFIQIPYDEKLYIDELSMLSQYLRYFTNVTQVTVYSKQATDFNSIFDINFRTGGTVVTL